MLDEVEIEGTDDGSSDEGGSWFSRASGGTRTFSAGFIFLASLFVLFWNESYSKKHADGLAELADQVQSAQLGAVNPALDGKPIHLSARVHSQAGARDPFFGIGTDGAVLYRHVEMFQWIEYEETTGRGRKKRTTYHYEQGWDSEYHDSSQFHQPQGHENPRPVLESDGFFAADARFGPYRFDSEEVARQALWEIDTPDEPNSLGNWPKYLQELPRISSGLAAKRWYQLEPGVYYRGNEASNEPELGDLQVSFYAYSNDYPLTLIARQEGEHLYPWRASNGDEILLAAGGTLDARSLVRMAEEQQDSLTHTLRIVGLAGAVIGAAGVASWLGGFLSMIPVVGRLVSVSLAIAGGLFGLIAGLVTIVVGWLAARPWIAALLLIAIGSAVTWAIQKRRKADQAAQRARRASSLAAAARARAAQALQAATPAGMVPATAGGPALPPPPPPGPGGPPAAKAAWAAKLGATPGAQKPPVKAPPPPPVETREELPPLEWTPGLISTKPPAVRTPAAETPRASERPAAPAAPVAPPRPAAPAAASPPAAPGGIPGFDMVDARPPAAPGPIPGFDLIDAPPASKPAAPVIPGFDIIEAPTATAAPPTPRTPSPARPAAPPSIPGFDVVEQRRPAEPLFDTVPLRDASAPRFDLLPMDEGNSEFPDLPMQGALSSPITQPVPVSAPAPQPAPARTPAPAPAAPKNVRIALGTKGEYALNKIVRHHPDGRQDVICFELMRAGQPVKRGTQDEVKEALRQALMAGR
ncbi:MAG: TMEM43 family protein [Rhodanobacteraceae bacterium]|nr:TMEM43 family protein [Rhodanobacteraceae bacterium]